MTETKKLAEKYTDNALALVEVTSEALTLFEDQPWCTPVQIILFALKLMILMYEQEPQPRSAATDTECANTAAVTDGISDVDEIGDDSQHTTSPGDTADDEQSHPE